MTSKRGEASDDLYAEGIALFNKLKSECSEMHNDWNEQYRFVIDGKQWGESTIRSRTKQKRPALTVNILKRIVQDEVNRARKASPSIKVKPSASKDIPYAQLVERKIGEIQYNSSADTAYDIAAEHALVGGIGFLRVDVDYPNDNSMDLEVIINKVIDPTKVYFDATVPTVDGSEWTDVFIVFTDEIEGDSGLFKDGTKQCYVEWFQKTVKQVKMHKLDDGSIVSDEDFDEAFYAAQGIKSVKQRKAPKATVTKHTLGEKLISSVVVAGGLIPIVPVLGSNYVVDGKWKFKGVVSDSMDSQVSYNIARSKMTEVINTSPKVSMIVGKGGVVDANKWSQLNDPNIPYLEYDYAEGVQAPIPLAKTNDVGGVSNLAESFYNDIKLIQGIQENTNTEEFLAKLKGDTANYHFTDNLSKSIARLGRVVLAMIPDVYEVEVPTGFNIEVTAGDNPKNRVDESIYTLTELIRVFPEGRSILVQPLLQLMDFEGKDTVLEQTNKLINPEPVQENAAPTLEQQMLMLREQNIARDIEYKNAALQLEREKLDVTKIKDDNEMRIREALALKTIEVDTKALNIKQQAQDLNEVKAGVDIISKATT